MFKLKSSFTLTIPPAWRRGAAVEMTLPYLAYTRSDDLKLQPNAIQVYNVPIYVNTATATKSSIHGTV